MFIIYDFKKIIFEILLKKSLIYLYCFFSNPWEFLNIILLTIKKENNFTEAAFLEAATFWEKSMNYFLRTGEKLKRAWHYLHIKNCLVFKILKQVLAQSLITDWLLKRNINWSLFVILQKLPCAFTKKAGLSLSGIEIIRQSRIIYTR